MENASPLGRLAGGGLVAGAVGFALAGALHPGSSADSLREATIDILQEPIWSYPHWIALVTMLLLATTVWLLVDAAVTRGSAAAQIGARLTIVASLFMAVQAAAEVAAPSASRRSSQASRHPSSSSPRSCRQSDGRRSQRAGSSLPSGADAASPPVPSSL